MSVFDAKSVVAFVAGGAVAISAWTLGAASGGGPSAGTQAIAAAATPVVASAAMPEATTPRLVKKACADKKTGELFVIGAGTKRKRCGTGQVQVGWPAAPPSLLSADGSLRLTSPNKQYILVLNDAGVGLRGPGGSILIDRSSVKQFDSAGRAK